MTEFCAKMYFEQALKAHQSGEVATAKKLYLLELNRASANAHDALFNLGHIEMQSSNFILAADYFSKAIAINSKDAATFTNAGICYSLVGDLELAKKYLGASLELDPTNVQATMHLAVTLSRLGLVDEAVAQLEKAILIYPNNTDLLINAALALTEVGRHKEALKYFEKTIQNAPNDAVALSHYSTTLMELGQYDDSIIQSEKAISLNPNFSLAYLAKALTLHKLQDFDNALHNYKLALQLDSNLQVAQINIAAIAISKVEDENDFLFALKEAGKSFKFISNQSNIASSKMIEELPFFRLKHDFEQALFLNSKGIYSSETSKFLEVISMFIDEHKTHQGQQLITLTGEAVKVFSDWRKYSYIYQTPDIKATLNPKLDWHTIQEKYLSSTPELIYIDDFLSNEALKAFQDFSMYSKVWNKEYKGSYLGAFANQGFISPLHLKLALDLKRAMPKVFKEYPIGQLWGFKYDAQLGSGINVHADFAKVNLNFWITPTESNLDATSGGLRVYKVPAPNSWTFQDYNRNAEQIYEFLDKNNSSSVTVPYRGNRAVLFNSALFHETDAIKFKQGYENRRVNMTYLFGSQLA